MLLTVRQVAGRLNASLSTIYELIEDGSLPSYRIGRNGGAIRVDEGDLLAYLAQCRTAGRVPPPTPSLTPTRLKHLRA